MFLGWQRIALWKWISFEFLSHFTVLLCPSLWINVLSLISCSQVNEAIIFRVLLAFSRQHFGTYFIIFRQSLGKIRALIAWYVEVREDGGVGKMTQRKARTLFKHRCHKFRDFFRRDIYWKFLQLMTITFKIVFLGINTASTTGFQYLERTLSCVQYRLRFTLDL